MKLAIANARGAPLTVTVLALGMLLSSGCGLFNVLPPTGSSSESSASILSGWQAGAQRGDAHAQWQLGTAYLDGRYVSARDTGQARYWLGRASEQGYLPAQLSLADATERGTLDGHPDATAALQMYRRVLAAQACDPARARIDFSCGAAALRVARLIDQGGGNLQPDPGSVRSAYLAALHYSRGPAGRLAVLYRDGIGGPVDNQRAYFFALAGVSQDLLPQFRRELDATTIASIEQREKDWMSLGGHSDPFPDDSQNHSQRSSP